MRPKTQRLAFSLVAAASLCAMAPGASIDTAFTYQGQIKQAGVAVDDVVDLRFTLFRGPNVGDPIIAGPVTMAGVTVEDGLFNVDIDFGPNAFDGNNRWIGIEVAAPAGGSFVELSPRQKVMPTPYAIHAQTVDALPSVYTSPMNFTNASNQFTGSGGGLTNLNASNIATGTVGSDLLSGTYAQAMSLTNAANAFSGSGAGLTNLSWSNLVNVPAGFADGVDNGGEWSLNGTTVYYNGGSVGVGTNAPNILGLPARFGVETSTQLYGIIAKNTYDDPVFLSSAILGEGRDIGGSFYATSSTGRALSATAQSLVGPTYGLKVNALSSDGYAVHASSPGWAGYFLGKGFFSGDVGVGTSTPGAKLEAYRSNLGIALRGQNEASTGIAVSAYASASSGANFALIAETNSLTGYAGFFIGGRNFFGGKVGVGALSPEVKLHVDGGGDVEPGFGGYFVIGPTTGINLGFDNNEIMARNDGAASTLFLNNDGGDVSVCAAGSGKLITPIIQITGGSDLSEQFEIAPRDDMTIEPGMVVCIDPANPGRLVLSERPYASTVAGIISGAGGVNTGMMMGQEGTIADGSHPVALTGRVYCYVDATDQAIKPGDLLTTSRTPGHAMKVTDAARAHGSIIGKAMTSLDKGDTGLVLVLVSLH